MKPNDYIKKYNLDTKKFYNREEFDKDFTNDFFVMLEYHSLSNDFTLTKFNLIVSDMRQKLDSIKHKVAHNYAPEKFDKYWGYFFATTVAKVREEMFGAEIRAKKEAWEKRQREERAWSSGWGWGFWDDVFNRARDQYRERLAELTKILIAPVEAFNKLGLSKEARPDEIKANFRELAMKKHPDKGGNKDEMIALIEAKNQCLEWAERKGV